MNSDTQSWEQMKHTLKKNQKAILGLEIAALLHDLRKFRILSSRHIQEKRINKHQLLKTI